jgi:hypothetical protein
MLACIIYITYKDQEEGLELVVIILSFLGDFCFCRNKRAVKDQEASADYPVLFFWDFFCRKKCVQARTRRKDWG